MRSSAHSPARPSPALPLPFLPPRADGDFDPACAPGAAGYRVQLVQEGGTRRVQLVREGGTRRVQLIREGGGRAGGDGLQGIERAARAARRGGSPARPAPRARASGGCGPRPLRDPRTPPPPRPKWTRRVPHPVLINSSSPTLAPSQQGGRQAQGCGAGSWRCTSLPRTSSSPARGTRRVRLVRGEGRGVSD
jgi:hypothetical protein